MPKLLAYLVEISVHPLALKVRDAQGYIGWLSQATSKTGRSLRLRHRGRPLVGGQLLLRIPEAPWAK